MNVPSEAENWAVIIPPISNVNNLIKLGFMAFQEGIQFFAWINLSH